MSEPDETATDDIVIVGADSAGSVLANRLSVSYGSRSYLCVKQDSDDLNGFVSDKFPDG